MVKLTKETKIKIIFLFFAIVVMWFTSQCSFRYSINDSVDSNKFLMGGKLLLNERYAYKDFLDYKGILIYLVHALSLMIFPNSFHGIYFLEIALTYCFYLYTYKSISIVRPELNKYYISIASIISCTLGYVSINMTNGDQIEEFSLPFIAYFIYILIKYFYLNEINKKEYIFIGLHIGLLFWSKFLCLIPHFVLFVALIIYFIVKHKYKTIITVVQNLLLGFIIITIPVLLYFIFTDTFFEMCKIYFYDNIFDYGRQKTTSNSFIFLVDFIAKNKYIAVIYLSCILLNLVRQKGKNFKVIVFVILHIITIIIITLCNAWQYYYMPTYAFIPLEFIYVMDIFKRNFKIYTLILCIILMILSYFDHMNNHYPNKEWAKQYKVAEQIKKEENPRVLNIDFDTGFLLASDVLPIDYYFSRMSRHDADIMAHYYNLVKEQKCDFVIADFVGTKDHTDIDWTNEQNKRVNQILNDSNYNLVYYCDDKGRDDYTEPYSMIVLYKLVKR